MVKILATVISIIISFMLGHRELEQQKNAWIALGGTLDPSTLDAPPLPDAQNAAVAYEPLFSFLNGLTPEEQDLFGEDPAEVPEVEALLIKCHDVIVKLRLASQIPGCRWNVKYEDWLNTVYYHYGESRKACRLLKSDARLASSQGRDMDAVQDIESILRIAKHMSNDRTMIGLLVAIGELRQGTDLFEELFRRGPAPDSEIMHLTQRFDPRKMFRRMLFCEVAISEAKMSQMMSEDGWDGFKVSPVGRLESDWDRAYFLKVMCGILEDCDKTFYEAPIQEDNLPSYAITSKLFLPAFSRSAYSAAMAHLRILMLQTADKLRAYKAELGEYPKVGVIEMPIDPVTGERLVYGKVGEGFVLTSEVVEHDGKKIEWVWEK